MLRAGWHAVNWIEGFTLLHWAAEKGLADFCRQLHLKLRQCLWPQADFLVVFWWFQCWYPNLHAKSYPD